MIDTHCHILPGFDDGPATMAEAVLMSRRAALDGIATLIATPHRGNGAYMTEGPKVLHAVDALNKVLAAENIPVTIIPGHENHIYPELLDDIKSGEALTFNNARKTVLLESPFMSVPFYVDAFFDQVSSRGMVGVFSHPERNVQIQEDLEVVTRLKKKGAWMQVTAMSITGAFGDLARTTALELLRRGYVDLIASDTHDPVHRPPVLSDARRIAASIIGEVAATRLVEDNPKALLFV